MDITGLKDSQDTGYKYAYMTTLGNLHETIGALCRCAGNPKYLAGTRCNIKFRKKKSHNPNPCKCKQKQTSALRYTYLCHDTILQSL